MRQWPQFVDKILAALCLAQAAIAFPSFVLVNSRTGPANYDPDDVYLDAISTVALLLFLSYGLWRHRAWAYFGLGIAAAALCAAVLAAPGHPTWTWFAATAFAVLGVFSAVRFKLDPKPV